MNQGTFIRRCDRLSLLFLASLHYPHIPQENNWFALNACTLHAYPVSFPGVSSFACENPISTGPGLEGTLTDVTFGAGDGWVVFPGTVCRNITLDRKNWSFLKP